MPPKPYRSRPVEIKAMQLTETNRDDVAKWVGSANLVDKPWDSVNLHIKNEHGVVVAEPSDWVIQGSRGEFYPCKNSTFTEKYVEVVK